MKWRVPAPLVLSSLTVLSFHGLKAGQGGASFSTYFSREMKHYFGEGYTVSHPYETAQAITGSVRAGIEHWRNADAFERSRMFGSGLSQLALAAVGTKGLDKLGKVAKLDRLARGGRLATAAPGFTDDFDRLARYAPRVQAQSDGLLNVVTHANSMTAYVKRGGKDIAVGHRSLARYIEGLPEYGGQGVRLVACNAGACSTGLAQNLANKLGVQVQAATNKVYVLENGNFFTSGEFVNFYPGKN